jgi:hypothetical protein
LASSTWNRNAVNLNPLRNSSPAKPRGDEVPEWDFEIKKKSMDSWGRSFRLQIVPPVPLLESYYWTLGPGDSLEALSANLSQTLPGRLSDLMADQKNLQRIKIISHILHTDLELLTSSVISFPIM